jgi:HEPN domain-containing protein
MPPTTYKDWMEIATERSKDAEELANARSNSVAAPYIAGYCVECALKAYLNKLGMPFPAHGREGHNLRSLWRKANFRKFDIKDNTGAKTYYIESWDTSLRYEKKINAEFDAVELINGAKRLTQWVFSQIRRTRR